MHYWSKHRVSAPYFDHLTKMSPVVKVICKTIKNWLRYSGYKLIHICRLLDRYRLLQSYSVGFENDGGIRQNSFGIPGGGGGSAKMGCLFSKERGLFENISGHSQWHRGHQLKGVFHRKGGLSSRKGVFHCKWAFTMKGFFHGERVICSDRDLSWWWGTFNERVFHGERGICSEGDFSYWKGVFTVKACICSERGLSEYEPDGLSWVCHATVIYSERNLSP